MTEKERKLQDLLDGYNTAKKALDDEADEPVKAARKEQNDRISGKAKENAKAVEIAVPKWDMHTGKRNDATDMDELAAARAEQNRRIAANNQ